jgi:hypothetical protein
VDPRGLDELRLATFEGIDRGISNRDQHPGSPTSRPRTPRARVASWACGPARGRSERARARRPTRP